MRARRRGGLIKISCFVLCILCGNALASPQTDDVVIVVVREGQSVREIAQTHLGDANLWQELLRENNLQSITDVRPGLKLRVPTGRISLANRALKDSLVSIQRATQEGARVFAPLEIGEAIRLHDEALSLRSKGVWDHAKDRAEQARRRANDAMTLAAQNRDTMGQAVLSDREGWVEGRKPAELLWSDRALHDVLVEQEKVRTLSRSSAQIAFLDDSRLRLNANSQAVIYRMRVDQLSRREQAKVSLIAGDFYTALAGKSQRKTFELEVPEVDTHIESRSFWVRHDASGSKFTNFDTGILRVAAKGQGVDLGQNEAAVVRRGKKPSEKIKIVGAPSLSVPADNAVAFSANVDLHWQSVENAAGYWLEVALDPAFNRMSMSRWGVTNTRFRANALDIGTYYWRVAGLDKFGLPGARSDVWRFHVRVDRTPPYLLINEPKEGAIIRVGPVRVRGKTERDATLMIAQTHPAVGEKGAFQWNYVPEPGLNRIVVTAQDPAGNVTKRERSFLYAPDESTFIAFDENLPQLTPRHFLTSRDVLSLAGETKPHAQVVIWSEQGAQRGVAYTDDAGRFNVNVPIKQSTEAFDVEIVERSGLTSQERFDVTVDREAPHIALDASPPLVTAVEWLPLEGRADGASQLSINGRSVKLDDGRFATNLTLQEGANGIELVATDRVGNVGALKLNVNLDQTPPKLVAHKVSKADASERGAITVTVTASDASGLKKVAPFTLKVGSQEYSDFLNLDQSSGIYRAVVQLPKETTGAVSLRDVEIEDYAGNRTRFPLAR